MTKIQNTIETVKTVLLVGFIMAIGFGGVAAIAALNYAMMTI